MLVHEVGSRARQQGMRQRRQAADDQPALCKGAQCLRGGCYAVQPDVAAFDLFQQSLRTHSGPQAPAQALEQLHAQQQLEPCQFPAHCRL